MSVPTTPRKMNDARTLTSAAARARRARRRQGRLALVAYLVCSMLAGALLAATGRAAPLWTHKPAGDIEWYRVTDVGTVLVGTKGSLYLLDAERR